MLRKTLMSGVLSIALVATSMPSVAAPLAPSAAVIDSPAVTLVDHKKWRRSHRLRRRHIHHHHDDDDFDGVGIAAGIIGFGLGAALAGAAARDRRACYVRGRNGLLYRVHCGSVLY